MACNMLKNTENVQDPRIMFKNVCVSRWVGIPIVSSSRQFHIALPGAVRVLLWPIGVFLLRGWVWRLLFLQMLPFRLTLHAPHSVRKRSWVRFGFHKSFQDPPTSGSRQSGRSQGHRHGATRSSTGARCSCQPDF